ncbi:MAG: choice-of-anchor D domain-containing protein [Terriglobales bacterium]
MLNKTKDRAWMKASHGGHSPWPGATFSNALLIALLAAAMLLSGCSGGASNADPQPSATLSGNWQFTVAAPSDGSYSGGLQGGFLLQSSSSVTGAAIYSVSAANIQPPLTNPCNSGSAPLTGTLTGQNVSLTAVAGTQTFTFTGTLSSNGSTMSGTYSSTAGTAGNGVTPCGTVQSGLAWSAISVPSITGPVQGSFHSTGGSAGLSNQDFLVSGTLTQGQNVGASNVSITGGLSFVNAATNLSDYPCFSFASVVGQISGNSVILQLIGTNGSTVGQIGEPAALLGSTGINPVTFDSAQGGYILHGGEPSYMVASKPCGGTVGTTTSAGDYGNICLALGNSNACQEPISLSPAAVTFPAQVLGTAATIQTITVANNSSITLNNLTLNFSNNGDTTFDGESDFNGLPSFGETDACGAGGSPSNGEPFDLNSGQSCIVTVSFSPQESCPWLPFGNPPAITGAAPEWCPFPQTAQVTVNGPASADGDASFTVPITGVGLSAIEPSTPELDFGAEEQHNPPEASSPQTLSFTNMSAYPLQILGSAPCTNPPKGQNMLPHPLLANSPVAGLQVVSNGSGSVLPISPDGDTITYNCDSDPGTALPNFQILEDTCIGTVLTPQASCSLQIKYAPQPNTDINSGLDYFLELNTVQCSSTVTSNCEIDSGRFPVELKANTPSPLRMSPSAGLDFGIHPSGTTSAPLTITLLNDPTLANPQTISFVGKFVVQGNYSETDNCPVTLAPGSSCTLTVTFSPSGVGFTPGTLTINYSPEPFGAPQYIYLRGTGE